MRSEAEFSSFILQQLGTLLKQSDLSIAEGKNILTDVTCIYEKGKFELMHGFSQTDISIFKEITFKYEKNDFITFFNDTQVRSGIFSIPFVILELKTGALTTDGIRSRDFVASRIREMFPFCAYYFIAESTKKEEKTLLRQGKSFTNYFISKGELTPQAFEEIFKSYISPHIENLKKQLKRIG